MKKPEEVLKNAVIYDKIIKIESESTKVICENASKTILRQGG
jgi:hypothetical protein